MSLGILIKGLSNCKKKWHTSVYHWGYNIQEYTPTILQSSQSYQLPWRENTTRPCTPQINSCNLYTSLQEEALGNPAAAFLIFPRPRLTTSPNLRPYLVGGIPTPLKKYDVSSSVGMTIPNIWKNKTCSKPPISYCYNHSRSQISRSSFGWAGQEFWLRVK